MKRGNRKIAKAVFRKRKRDPLLINLHKLIPGKITQRFCLSSKTTFRDFKAKEKIPKSQIAQPIFSLSIFFFLLLVCFVPCLYHHDGNTIKQGKTCMISHGLTQMNTLWYRCSFRVSLIGFLIAFWTDCVFHICNSP